MIVATSLFASSTFAQAASHQFVELKYELDPTLRACPSMAEFRGILEQQLGYDPHRAGLPMKVEVRVSPTQTGIEGIIHWNFSSPSGETERRLASRFEDCDELMATLGFVVAVQIQLMATTGRENAHEPVKAENASTGRDGTDSKSRTTLTLERFELRRATSLRPSWAIVGLGPSVGFGLGPKPVALGRLFFAVRSGWLGLDASVAASKPVEAHESYGGGIRHAVVLGALGFCAWHAAMSACALTTLGQLQIQGLDVDRPASPKGLLAQLGPRVAHSFRLSDHLMVLSHIEVLYLLTPWTADLNRVTVWKMSRVGAAAGLDLAFRF
jgi:hypothetical protein